MQAKHFITVENPTNIFMNRSIVRKQFPEETTHFSSVHLIYDSFYYHMVVGSALWKMTNLARSANC